MKLSVLFHILIFVFLQTGSYGYPRPERDEAAAPDTEKDLFELWMKEMETGFDKDFEEFVKEAMGGEETPSRNLKQSRKVSQTTTDKFQELVASMRKDTTDDFWVFMKGVGADMETSFEGFMKTMENEMDENFDQMFQTVMGEDSRTIPITFEEKFQQWKNGELEVAYSKFVEYSDKRRNVRSIVEYDEPSLLKLQDYTENLGGKKNTINNC